MDAMDGAEESTIASSADRSNLSTPESSSSEVSQPTVRLRASSTKKSKSLEIGNDVDQPFIRTLDQDGRRLVETTGRTAQLARALKQSSRSNPRNSCDLEVSRRSSERGYEPRKCRSTTSVEIRDKNTRRIKRHHYSCGMEGTRRSLEQRDIAKRYSAGDYLRQQIMEDLGSNELIGKSEEQIAQDRCERVKAYLRRGNPSEVHHAPHDKLRELRDRWRSEGRLDTNDASGVRYSAARRNDLDRIRTYLQEKIREKMIEEVARDRAASSGLHPNELCIRDIRRRYPDYRRSVNYPERRVRSDLCLGERLAVPSSECEREEASRRCRTKTACRRSRSNVVPETVIDPEDKEIRKRFHSYTHGLRKNWQTKSCTSFETKLSLPANSTLNLERETSDSTSDPGNNRTYGIRVDRCRKKYCRRSRSDTLPEKMFRPNATGRRTKRRSVSWSDKRKFHRVPSERLASLADETSLESDVAFTTGPANRTERSHLCSWREYKEKRRQERLLKESKNVDQDVRKIGHWNNLGDLERSAVPAYTVDEISTRERMDNLRERGEETDEPNAMNDVTRTNENGADDGLNVGDPNADTETETIIQENYLLLEGDVLEASLDDLRDTDVTPNERNMVDCGYDTIPKRRHPASDARREWTELNAHSRVKKTDTFKIVDGSEDALDDDEDNDRKIGSFDTASHFWPSNEIFGHHNPGVDSCRLNPTDRDYELSSTRRNDKDENEEAVSPTSNDAAKNYFRRVYELLKQRQDTAKRKSAGVPLIPVRYEGDTSSSNCAERAEQLRRRRRRRKKDKTCQGEELVAVSPGVDEENDWTVQKLLENEDPTGNLIFRRAQLQNVTGQKRPRHPAPPIPANCRINAKDISKYFDYPNKENSSPARNGVNENGRRRNEVRNDTNREQEIIVVSNSNEMGSNLSRHNGKGLTGRRTQSSGNLCDPKGKLNHVGKILVPCSSSQRERYKICGSLPNHLDDKEILEDEDTRENNNVISDTMVGNLGGTLPHKKRALGVHFSDTGPTGTLDLVKHRSQDSLEGDPWRYQDGVDLDLVRCKHGNFDSVRKNQGVDSVDGDSSSRRYGTTGRPFEAKCHRGAELDLVGTLPKRKIGDSKGAVLRQNRTVDRLDDDLLMKVPHKPDCELMKHRQLDRVVDLKLSRLISGEPQDQGYASERSPEDEQPPSLPGQHFPNVTPESTFRVTLQKSSRGLGLSLSGGGTAGPVRVKRLFPQQPAALSNKLQSGDILLAANGIPLTGLTNYEALEVLRTTPSTVELVVCRLPGDASITPPGAPPPPPARREPPSSLRILNPLPPLQIEPCGEFDIEMTKVAGSLGFTLRKVDSSALGHYVRALVREPALSDGRIQPGDKIVAVDGATLSPMSHEEAVALLRQCGPRVKLRLYRDLAQTPVSALSPTEPDHPLRPPRTSLRQEAVDMLCDLAVRKLSPGTSNGSTAIQTSAGTSNSPRRLRRPASRTPTAENEHENHLTFHPVNPILALHNDESETDQCSIKTQATNSETPTNDIIDPPPLYDVCDSSDSSKFAPRPSFLNLGGSAEKTHFQFSLESDSDYTGPTIVTESDSNPIVEHDYRDNRAINMATLSSDETDNNLPCEPASMPPLLSTTRNMGAVFSYKNPAYQSANPTCGGIDNSAKNKAAHSSDQDIPGKVLGAEDPAGSKGLLKWKGVMFAPDDDVEETTGEKSEAENTARDPDRENAMRQNVSEEGSEVFMVELTRGWNSRLGFSLQAEGNSTVISVVHPDSVAAKDGRLKQGDVLIMVNDESVESMATTEIIDLLRKIRGSIGITVKRKTKTKAVS